jgi:cytochrome c oxidase subunit 2
MMETNFRLWPDQASTLAPRLDTLFGFISLVAVFFTLLIAILVLFFAIRYRRRSDDYFPTPVVGSKALEMTWTFIPLVLAMIMFFWGAAVYFDVMRPPDDALEVYVTGRQWMWHLQHPGGQREINTLHVPVGRAVKLIMTSEDVIHDFAVPAFRVKMDVVPGKYTNLWFQATRPGTYRLYCAEYCGMNHSRMKGYVVALEPAEYEQWLAGQLESQRQKGEADLSMALKGRQLFQKLQCVTCHHTEAGNRGPNLEELYGRRVELEGGRTAIADETYLRESVLFPANKVRAGYRPIMPTYKEQVNEQELVQVIAFLKGLRQGQTPARVERAEPPEVKEK